MKKAEIIKNGNVNLESLRTMRGSLTRVELLLSKDKEIEELKKEIARLKAELKTWQDLIWGKKL